MTLITLRDVGIRFGETALLEGVSLTVAPGERICLLGRNGTGKSTLIGIIGGDLEPDHGEVVQRQGLVVSGLTQGVPEDLMGTVLDAVCSRMGERGRNLVKYRQLCDQHDACGQTDPALQKTLLALQHTIDAQDGWPLRQQIERTLSQMGLPMDGEVSTFSAGMKRQVLLAAALAAEPDLLLLDEPTNHLDMGAIEWLESFLLKWTGTLILITHDRMMIRKLATRVLEIDRGAVYSWNCTYDDYLQRSQARLDAEEKENARFDKKLSAEEAWIRQGIKARRTRNEGRVRELQRLREVHRNRRDRTGKVRMRLEEAERSGKVVAEATGIRFAYDARTIIDDFSCTILRGDRIGILGPNGAGKSTLIRVLLGELDPQQGRIKHGTNLKVIYFDQLRGQLDEQKTVQENVSPDSDMIDVGGRRRHVIGYLKDFLFSPQRARSPVWVLSGGEKNRLLLAKLFARPANVLVLDEPTNDLDVETLELLEELLLDFSGTVLLVSHDRAFINNVVTRTLVFEGRARIEGYAGGYDDWLIQRPEPAAAKPEKASPAAPRKTPPSDAPKKRGYMQQRELDALPGHIESLEARQQELFNLMADPDFFRQDGEQIAEVKRELDQIEKDLEAAFSRWEALENI
ncbi:ATP-binding cassette domain-containing protein [Desulfosarcina ovata]|uniref:ATP-binding protein Uup n=1 Tax=Desulfosarcina ovata subsp. ovata TaxID=2752305 RepID=A0A5K8A864_9BACT|nr:ATP-binding cassette domain-containing protein [Desulfosarcina ovata]BBO88727.1 heme ABC transporter ATPase [Desulfosarcina ovata subsp. ovata]